MYTYTTVSPEEVLKPINYTLKSLIKTLNNLLSPIRAYIPKVDILEQSFAKYTTNTLARYAMLSLRRPQSCKTTNSRDWQDMSQDTSRCDVLPSDSASMDISPQHSTQWGISPYARFPPFKKNGIPAMCA